MTAPIGGFMELELGRAGQVYHEGSVAMSVGRACLSLVIQQLRPAKLFLPFYSCDALLAPILQHGVAYEFYRLDAHLEPREQFIVGPDEYILYINYFGIKTAAANRLAMVYPGKLIVDNAQAFFERGPIGLCAFNSARKFFGVPDGAYLYFPAVSDITLERNAMARHDHLIERLEGRLASAYQRFQDNERGVSCEVRRISKLSEELLARVDYAGAASTRQANQAAYQHAFGSVNRLQVAPSDDDVPMCYPLLLDHDAPTLALRDRGILVPTYWTELEARPGPAFAFERAVGRNLLALPLDQRYGATDCQRVIDEVNRLLDA